MVNEDHWHDLRKRHVGGTESAALFGLSPYISAFELYHRKIGNIPEPDFSDNDRIFWGKFLEPSIAAGVADIKGWKVAKVTDYMINDDCPGHGASLDYEILEAPRVKKDGPGILEIKTCDFLTFKSDWEDEAPPLQYELQLQTQMACSGFLWGTIAVLIGGNQLKTYDYEARPRTIAKIEEEVQNFWWRVKNRVPPNPIFEVDYEVLSKLHDKAGGGWVNLTGHEQAEAACRRYHAASQTGSEAEKLRKAARGELLTYIGNADTATCGEFKITTSEVAPTHVAFDKPGFRSVRVTRKDKS